MAKYTINQKNKVFKKLRSINIITEKDILNLKVSKLKELLDKEKITINELEIIWLIQEAIENKTLLEFLINSE